jgi:chromosome segregation and condensation protein ScpB
MKKLTVNAIFSAMNEGLSDEELKRMFGIEQQELITYKILKKQKAVHPKFDIEKQLGVHLGSKTESYYTEEELLNCTHRWMTKENKIFK